MYRYIYYHEILPCSMIIIADNKKEANEVLKEFESYGEWIFQEREKN